MVLCEDYSDSIIWSVSCTEFVVSTTVQFLMVAQDEAVTYSCRDRRMSAEGLSIFVPIPSKVRLRVDSTGFFKLIDGMCLDLIWAYVAYRCSADDTWYPYNLRTGQVFDVPAGAEPSRKHDASGRSVVGASLPSWISRFSVSRLVSFDDAVAASRQHQAHVGGLSALRDVVEIDISKDEDNWELSDTPPSGVIGIRLSLPLSLEWIQYGYHDLGSAVPSTVGEVFGMTFIGTGALKVQRELQLNVTELKGRFGTLQKQIAASASFNTEVAPENKQMRERVNKLAAVREVLRGDVTNSDVVAES